MGMSSLSVVAERGVATTSPAQRSSRRLVMRCARPVASPCSSRGVYFTRASAGAWSQESMVAAGGMQGAIPAGGRVQHRREGRGAGSEATTSAALRSRLLLVSLRHPSPLAAAPALLLSSPESPLAGTTVGWLRFCSVLRPPTPFAVLDAEWCLDREATPSDLLLHTSTPQFPVA